MKTNTNKGRHLTFEDRLFIQNSLVTNDSFYVIAQALKKDPTTISKEIKKHKITEPPNPFNNLNQCLHRFSCHRVGVCGSLHCGNRKCRQCPRCNASCKAFKQDTCSRSTQPPYVCNGCVKLKNGCHFETYLYKATIAHRDYREALVESRRGINLTAAQLAELDELVTPLIRNKQPISHIFANHGHEIPCSVRTLYSYIENQYLSARNHDLNRKVRYKIRKKPRPTRETLLAIRLHRRYRDFIEFIEEFDPPIVEMDTVMGSSSSKKCLLTIFFKPSKFMLAFLLDGATQANVQDVFDSLEKMLGANTFRKLFPVILTDNGSEFLNPFALEKSLKGGKRTMIFYCDPNCAFQKGAIEKNHEYIRYVLPKGLSFDSYIQEDIQLLTSHINSTARDSLNGKTPFQATDTVLKSAVTKLGLTPITPDEVNLSPSLLMR